MKKPNIAVAYFAFLFFYIVLAVNLIGWYTNGWQTP
jgi:hypothetical protein